MKIGLRLVEANFLLWESPSVCLHLTFYPCYTIIKLYHNVSTTLGLEDVSFWDWIYDRVMWEEQSPTNLIPNLSPLHCPAPVHLKVIIATLRMVEGDPNDIVISCQKHVKNPKVIHKYKEQLFKTKKNVYDPYTVVTYRRGRMDK